MSPSVALHMVSSAGQPKRCTSIVASASETNVFRVNGECNPMIKSVAMLYVPFKCIWVVEARHSEDILLNIVPSLSYHLSKACYDQRCGIGVHACFQGS